MEPLPTFIPFSKCAGLSPDPRYYIPQGGGRDYYVTHDLYDKGNDV